MKAKHTPFPIPKRITMEPASNGGPNPEYEFHCPELRIRVGPLYDGSGLRDRYPDGMIRTSKEAKKIAMMLRTAWNKTYGARK